MSRLIGIFLFLLIIIGCEQGKPEDRPRGFDDDRLAELKETNQFDYNQSIEAYDTSQNPVLNFFRRILQGIVWFLSNLFGYIIILFLLIMVLWFIISRQQLKFKEDQPPEVNLRSFDPENLNIIDFQPLIEQALVDGNYRLAIRYCFLNTLKGLNLNEQIKLKDSKTNHQYYYELDTSLRSHYLSLLKRFEFIWYGEFPADKQLYSEVSSLSSELLLETKRETHA